METIGLIGVVGGIVFRLWPVWVCMAAMLVAVYLFKPRLGLFGQLFNTGVGTAGVLICAFWVFSAIFADTIAPLGPRMQLAAMKNAVPGAIDPETGIAFLLGGDNLGSCDRQTPTRQAADETV